MLFRIWLTVPPSMYIHCTGVPLKKMEETSYFFRMSKYKARLVEHIKASPNFILPDSRRNLILGAYTRTHLSICFDLMCTCPTPYIQRGWRRT